MAFVIPSIFKAIDQFTTPVRTMASSVDNLTERMRYAAATSERAFNNATSVLGDAVTRRIKYLVSLGKALLVIGAAVFSVKSIMDYQRELATLQSLTGVTGAEFTRFKGIIHNTAVDTKTSAVEVTKAFTNIANMRPEILQDADALAQMTTASITLAKASRMELEPASVALTDIMNKFGIESKHASQIVDMMAAGSKYGSAEIRDLSDAIVEFGAQAKLTGVSLKESIAITELVSKFRRGTQAGTELRMVFQKISEGQYSEPEALKWLGRLGVNARYIADKTVPLISRLRELAKLKDSAPALNKVFEARNVGMASEILNNLDKFEPLIKNLDEEGLGAKMAAVNTNTLYYAIDQLKAAWVNIVTGSGSANIGLSMLTRTTQFLGDHLGAIASIVVPVLAIFTAWKIKIWAVQAATVALTTATKVAQFWLGVATVVTQEYATACFATASGMRGMAFASFFLEAGLMGSLGILSLFAAGLFIVYSRMTDTFDESVLMNQQLEKNKNGFAQLSKPLSDAQIALSAYNKAMEDYNAGQRMNKILDWEDQHRGRMHAVVYRLTHMFEADPSAQMPTTKQFGLDPNHDYTKDSDVAQPTSMLEKRYGYDKNSEKDKQEIVVTFENAPAGMTATGNENTNIKITPRLNSTWS